MLHVAVAVDFAVQGDEAVEFRLLRGDAAVQVFPVEVDVIGPAVNVVVAVGGDGAAVDPGVHVGKGHFSVVVVDVPFHVVEVQGRHVEFRYGDGAVSDGMGQGPAAGGGEGHLIVDAIAKAHGGRIYPHGGDGDGGGKFFFFEIDFTVRFHPIPHHGAAEFTGFDVEPAQAAGIDAAVDGHVVHEVPPLPVEGLHPCVVDGDGKVQGLSLAVEVGNPVFQVFIVLPVFFFILLDFALFPVYEVHVHVFVEVDRKDRTFQGDFLKGGGDKSLLQDIPGIHLEGAGRDPEDRVALRVVPGKIRKGDTAVDIGGDGLHGNGAPEHVLPGGGVVEEACGAVAQDFCKKEKKAEKGGSKAQNDENVPGPVLLFPKFCQFFLHRNSLLIID